MVSLWSLKAYGKYMVQLFFIVGFTVGLTMKPYWIIEGSRFGNSESLETTESSSINHLPTGVGFCPGYYAGHIQITSSSPDQTLPQKP